MSELSTHKKQQLVQLADDLRALGMTHNKTVVEIGRLLLAAQKILPDEESFNAWTREITGWSAATCHRYIGVSLRFGDVEPKLLRNIGDSALYKLATAPQPVVDKALDAATSGEHIKASDVTRFLREANPTKKKKRKATAAKRDEPEEEPEVEAERPKAVDVKDRLGNLLPKEIARIFSGTNNEVFEHAMSAAGALKRAIARLSKHDSAAFFALATTEKDLEAVRAAIAATRPYCLCPACEGDPTGKCECQGHGWMPKKLYERLSKDKQKWGPAR